MLAPVTFAPGADQATESCWAWTMAVSASFTSITTKATAHAGYRGILSKPSRDKALLSVTAPRR